MRQDIVEIEGDVGPMASVQDLIVDDNRVLHRKGGIA
jgi:hypothetical protein